MIRSGGTAGRECNNPPPGIFIVIEGIDCCGKGTVIKNLMNRQDLPELVTTEEPSTGETGRKIRDILEKRAQKPDGGAIAFQKMYVLDRAEHLETVIIPELAKGKMVISDRFAASTFAYGMAGLCGWYDIAALHERHIPRMIWPDLTIILDLPVEQAMKCLASKLNPSPQLFEKAPFLEKVRAAYHWLEESQRPLAYDPTSTQGWLGIGRIALVDATKSPSTVADRVAHLINDVVAEKKASR